MKRSFFLLSSKKRKLNSTFIVSASSMCLYRLWLNGQRLRVGGYGFSSLAFGCLLVSDLHQELRILHNHQHITQAWILCSLTHLSPTSGWLLILFIKVASPSFVHMPLMNVNSTSSNFSPLRCNTSLLNSLT